MKKLYLVFVSALLVSACGGADVLAPWREGYLDIHQVSTGRGNATFMILPDGTTMMVDMGDLGDTSHFRQEVLHCITVVQTSNTASLQK